MTAKLVATEKYKSKYSGRKRSLVNNKIIVKINKPNYFQSNFFTIKDLHNATAFIKIQDKQIADPKVNINMEIALSKNIICI